MGDARRLASRQPRMKTTVLVGGAPVVVDVTRGSDEMDALVGDTRYRVQLSRSGDTWSFVLDDRTVAATVVRERDAVWIAIGGEVYRCVAVSESRSSGTAAAHTPQVTAPMPGKVLDVRVIEGQQVATGEALIILEAMKMETTLSADAAGI